MSARSAARTRAEGEGQRRRGWPATVLMWVVAVVSVLCTAGVSVSVVLSRTTAGREFALGWALDRLRPAINGTIEVGSLAPGGILAGATLHDVRVSDSLGRPVLVADSMRARYSVAELLGGPPAIADLHLWSPVIDLEPGPEGPVRLSDLLVLENSGADPLPAAPGPALRIRGARIHGGTVVLRDDGGAERRVEGINVDFPRIDVGPGPGVYLSATIEGAALSYPVRAGRLELAGVAGAIEVGRGGITAELERFRLPGSEGRGRVLAEPGSDGGGWRTTLDLDLDRFSLTELSWLDERLDHGAARGRVRLTADAKGVLVDLTGFEVEADPGRFTLSGGVSFGDATRFRNLRFAPDMLATEEVERWLPDGLPLSGALSGDVRIDGVPGRLGVSGAMALVDDLTLDTVARLSGGGTVLGSRSFESVSVDITSLDYALLSAFVPRFAWEGRGEMSVYADGDLGTGMAVRVAASQSLADGPVSTVNVAGTLYGATEVSVVELEAALSPLSLSMIGELHPGFPLSGEVHGSVSLAGSLDQLSVAAELDTPAGHLAAEGLVNVRDPAAGYQMRATTRGFRLSELIDELPDSTVVSAAASLDGRGLDLESMRGALALDVGPSVFGPLRLDSAEANIWVDDDGLLHVESVYADAGGVVVRGLGGSVGAASGMTGEGVTLSVSSASILPLRRLFMGENQVAWDELMPIEQDIMIEVDGVDPDTFPRARDLRFEGKVDGEIRLGGELADLSATAAIALEGFEYGVGSLGTLVLDATARGLHLLPRDSAMALPPAIVVEGTVTGDSISFNGLEYRSALLEGNFRLGAGGRLRALIARSGSEFYEAQAVVGLNEEGGRVDLDRLTLVFDDRRWNLRGPARFEWDSGAVLVNDFGLIRPGSPGLRAYADGRFARRGGGSDFELLVTDLDLGMVGRLLQLEVLPAGVASAELRVTGSAEQPEWAGSILVEDAEYETFSFDRVTAAGTYADRSLATRLESWAGGRRTLRIEGTTPADLRLAAVEDRIPDEPVDLDVVADSFPAAMILGGLTSLEEVEGTVTGSVKILGRPSDLEPDGALRLERVAGLFAPLGVRLSSVQVDMRLHPDGTVVVEGSGESGGTVQVRGTVDASQLADPAFDLAFWPRELQVVDRRDMVAAVTGDSITLTGSYRYPFIEGALDVNGGTVFIEEFQRTSEAVDFYDPVLFSAATARIGSGEDEEGAGSVRARSPFLQNLSVFVDIRLDRGNWLRSRDMNVETSGDLSLTFDRRGNQLILQGEIEVVRGTYILGPRTLRMTEGVFQFAGTPGFNPGLSVTAENRLRTRDGEPLVITADISGTLLSAQTTLSSDAESAISQADLVSYLLVGRPNSALVGEGGAASVGATRNLLLSQVANEIGYLLAAELDVDHLSVSQAESGQANAAFGASSLQVEVGWYVRDDVFLTGVYQRGFCSDPTLPVSSGGVRVEMEMPRDVTLEGFLEGRCTRERYRGLGDLSLELARIWGFSLYREWGY